MASERDTDAPGSGGHAGDGLLLEDGSPGTASEKYLASLWCELIGLDQVQRGDRFSDVGGTSLTLNVILNRIQTEKGVSLDGQQFFEDDKSALCELAKALDLKLRAKSEATLTGGAAALHRE